MNVGRNIVWSILFAASALAAERPNELSTLFADAPADALGALYVQRPADLLGTPAHLLLNEDNAAPPVLEAVEALASLFDGPLALVVTGSPLRPDLLAVTITARVSVDQETFFKALDTKLIAALNRIEALPGAGAIGFDRAGDLAVVRFSGPVPVHFTFAFRDGYVRASSNRTVVDAWLAPAQPDATDQPKTFLDSDDFKRLVPTAAATPDLLLYVNLRTLMPLAKMGLPHDVDVYGLLGLGQVEAAGLTATWSHGQPGAALTVCLAGEPGGAMQLLRSTGRPVNIAKVFPPDTVFMLGGTFESGSVLVDQVNKLLELVDPEIVQEYEQERGEFLRDFGFDLQTDFLGNLVDEWAFALRAAADGLPEPLLAVRLADPVAFDRQLAVLTAAFDLKFNASTHGSVALFQPVRTAVTAPDGMQVPEVLRRLGLLRTPYYGVVGNYLVVGLDPAAVGRMIDAWDEQRSLHQTPGYQAATRAFAGGPAALAYANVSRMVELSLQSGELDAEATRELGEEFLEKLRRLAAGQASATLTLGAVGGSLRLAAETTGGNETGLLAGEALWRSIGASLARARELSKRAVSAANLSGIVRAARVYAAGHKNEWPASLSVLVDSGDISLEMLRNPYDSTGPRTLADAERESYYLYRKNIPKDAAATEVVAGEREVRRGEGANFAYADGHVEFVREPEAGRLLAILRAQSR